MNTEMANAVNAAGDKAQYDARVKRLLSQKSILAHILVRTVDEFKGMDPEKVVPYIEGEPMIDIVPVEPGLTNAEKSGAAVRTMAAEPDSIDQRQTTKMSAADQSTARFRIDGLVDTGRADLTGRIKTEEADTAGCINTAETDTSDCIASERMNTTEPTKAGKADEAGQRIVGFNTENAEINEGLVRFDIIFYVRMKNGLSQIIVNIECQKDEPSTYEILNRAIFYVSRIVSSQKERDFTNTNYDGIKQVFSIWICMNMDYNCLSHIHLTKDELLEPHEWKGNLDLLNIVMIGITNEIPERGENYELHRLIATLLSSDLKEHEKLKILEQEYNIPIDKEFRKDVKVMCNLSDGIEERAAEKATKRATEETTEKIILKMYANKISLDQISTITDKSIGEVKRIIKENKLVLA